MDYALNKKVYFVDLLNFLGLNGDEIDRKGREVFIDNVASQDACVNGSLSFTRNYQGDDKRSVFFVPANFKKVETLNTIYIRVDNPRKFFIQSLQYLVNNVGFSHFAEKPVVHPSVKIGENVVIEKGCVLEEGSVIEHNVVLHRGTRIGKYSIIRANSSIGGDGFGFERLPNGRLIRFPHLGGVVIGNYVEIGANTCIARGALSDTLIKDNVKIDNLVHIAHNCVLEEGVIVTAGAELSGGVVINKNSWIGPNACILQKITVGENSLVSIGAVVIKDVLPNQKIIGNPALDIRDFVRKSRKK